MLRPGRIRQGCRSSRSGSLRGNAVRWITSPGSAASKTVWMTRRESGPPAGAPDGVITREQAARAAGLGGDDHRRTHATWAGGRRARSTARPRTRRRPVAHDRGDALWLGPDAVLGGVAAAWWWGLLDEPPETVRPRCRRSAACAPRVGSAVERRDVAPATAASTGAWRSPPARGRRGATAPSPATAACHGPRAGSSTRHPGQSARGRTAARGRRGTARRGPARRGRGRRPVGGGAASLHADGPGRAHGMGRGRRLVLPGWGRRGATCVPGRAVVVEVDGWAYHRDLRASFRGTRSGRTRSSRG